jgi:hypothetical protein
MQEKQHKDHLGMDFVDTGSRIVETVQPPLPAHHLLSASRLISFTRIILVIKYSLNFL